MDNNEDKESLNIVIKMFKYVAETRYGYGPVTHYDKYRKVIFAATEAFKISTVIEDLKEGLAQACQENPNWFPAPQLIVNKVVEVKARRLKQNVKPDESFKEGNLQSIRRARVQTKYVESFGASGAEWCEYKWLKDEGLPDFKIYRLDFWGAVGRQEPKALAIIDSYEANRKTN